MSRLVLGQGVDSVVFQNAQEVVTVIADQTAADHSQPDEALAVLQNSADGVVRKSVVRGVLFDFEVLSPARQRTEEKQEY